MTHAGLDGLLMDLPPDPGGEPPPASQPWADLDAGASRASSTTGPTGAPGPTGFPGPVGLPSERAAVMRSAQLVPILVAVVVVAAFGIAIVAAATGVWGDDDTDAGSYYQVPTELDAPTSASTSSTTASTTTTAPAPAETAPPAPPPTNDHQELVVGVDITAGRYMQPDGIACFWEVRDGTGDAFALGGSDRPVLDVRDGEVVVLDFCGALVPYAPAAAPATSVGSGDWLVGEDLVAGTYRPSATDGFCLWERGNGFRHVFDEVIEWDDTRRDVTVRDGERFSSDGCGTWTKV